MLRLSSIRRIKPWDSSRDFMAVLRGSFSRT
jgi:hypothetical protein